MVHLSLYRILTKLAVFYRLIGVVFLILVCNSYSGEAFAKNELWNRCVGADIDARIVSCSQFIARGKRENKSNQIAAYISRASGYRANGDYDRALADLDKALRLDPKSAPALLERASIYDVKSEFDRAIADYDTVLKLDKDSLAVRSGRARAYRGKGEFDKALANFNEAVRLDPNLASTHVDRGAIYQAQGDFDRAIVDYDRAIQIDPKDANAFLGRANGYRGKHDLERAKQDLESALNSPRSSRQRKTFSTRSVGSSRRAPRLRPQRSRRLPRRLCSRQQLLQFCWRFWRSARCSDYLRYSS